MKRVLFVLLIVLAGCSSGVKIHEDVYDDLAMDSLQVFEILEQAADRQEQPNEPEQEVINAYIDKYGQQYENRLLEGINSGIYVSTEMAIEYLNKNASLGSSKDGVLDFKENVIYYIENGERK